MLPKLQKILKKQSINYEWLIGERRDGKLLYIPAHRCLYVKKRTKKNSTDYICYQSILAKNKTKNVDKTIPNCTASVKIDTNGNCTANSIAHTVHQNHEILSRDMKSKNNFLDEVVAISKMLVDLPLEVSNRDVFTRELSK